MTVKSGLNPITEIKNSRPKEVQSFEIRFGSGSDLENA